MKQWRGGALLVGCGAFLVAVSAWAPPLPAAGWSEWWSWLQADPQRALALVAGCAGRLLAAWLFLVTALRLLSAGTHAAGRAAGRAAELLTPRIARGMLEAVLGAALAVGSAGPALAGGAPAAGVSTAPSLAPVPAPLLAPSPLPPLLDLDRPDVKAPEPVAPQAAPAPVRPPAGRPTVTYEVRPGDTLWDLAAARLPAHSTAQRITRGWQEWYLANHQQIGPDPGLLLVGETLLVPPVQP